MIDYGTTLTVRRQRRNSDGDVSGGPTDTVTDGWEIAPLSSTERADGTRESTTTRLQAFGGPPAVDIGSGDRVFLADDDRSKDPPWYVVGDLERWGAPGWDPGAVLTLQRTTG